MPLRIAAGAGAAIVFAQRDGVPRLRAHHQHHVSGIGGTHSGLHSRHDADWKTQYDGVETMTLAVMGCIVNGPGESKAANIGISLPGTGEAPRCPVYIDGQKDVTLEGTYDELAAAFKKLVDNYVARKYPVKTRKPLRASLGYPEQFTSISSLPGSASPLVSPSKCCDKLYGFSSVNGV